VSDETDNTAPDELAALKMRAKLMGISFSNNVGLETLRERVNEKLDGANNPEPEGKQVNPLDPLEGTVNKAGKPLTVRQRLIAEQMKLVRIRVTCMNPNKKELRGEFFTVANDFIGAVKKFVPFGEDTEDGYHVPYCIYRMIEARRFVNITTTKDRRTGLPVMKSNDAREFAIEVLPQLTPKELKDLAIAQAAAGSLSD
jgi:hypothetical protein